MPTDSTTMDNNTESKAKFDYNEALEASTEYFNGNDLAAKVFLDKYALRNNNRELVEKTPDDMHWRMANEFARIEEQKYKNTKLRPLKKDEIFEMFDEFKKIIPQGGPMSSIGNLYQTLCSSNCVVIDSPLDSYGSILRADEHIAQLCKRRAGIGLALSNLRPEDVSVKNAAGSSTGIIPWMDRYSNTIREVAQNNRRGAGLLAIHIKHPESVIPWNNEVDGEPYEVRVDNHDGSKSTISSKYYNPNKLDFASVKVDPSRVTGANVSLQVDDEFMKCVKENKKYKQQWPIDSDNPTVEKWIDAREAWEKIIFLNHFRAEPGILFWSNIVNESPADCYAAEGFQSLATNPCLTGDTPVYVADGRGMVPIKQLAEEDQDVDVFCYDDNDKVTIKRMRNPRITGYNKPVYKVTLDDGSTIRATGNHKFKLTSGEYKEVKDLKPNDAMKILTRYQASIKDIFPKANSNSQDYWWVNNGFASSYPEHKYIAENYYNQKIKTGEVVHNVDEDPRLVKSLQKTREQGYSAYINNGTVYVYRNCEYCGKQYVKPYKQREISFCSNTCANYYTNKLGTNTKRKTSINQTYHQKAEKQKENQMQIFNDLKFELGREPQLQEWEERCGQEQVPFRLKTKHGFQNYEELKESAELVNHRVVKVEFDGYEDVYNGTVDEFHNFFSGGFEGCTKNNKKKFVCLNNRQCGEVPLSSTDSCRLLLINVFGFIENPFTSQAKFNWEKFYQYARYAQRLMDDVIDLELEMIQSIIDKIENDPEPDEEKRTELELWQTMYKSCEQGRRTGLGLTAIGSAVAGMNIEYASQEGKNFIENLYKCLKFGSYTESVEMAKELGPFPIWNFDKEKDNPYFDRLKNETFSEGDLNLNGSHIYNNMKRYGRRSIAQLTQSPSGSVSMLAKLISRHNTTSGIEPEFTSEPYVRRKKINHDNKDITPDFIDQNGDKWTEHTIYPPTIQEWIDLNPDKDISESPFKSNTAQDINWVDKVKIQCLSQSHIDHSISNTTNLPQDIEVDTVKDIYQTGWEYGAKGVTIYRDGCRSGVLVKSSENDTDKDGYPTYIIKTDAPKRPKEVHAAVHHTKVAKEDYFVIVGLLYGEPYEVFAGHNGFIPKSVDAAKISKIKRGHYQAILSNGDSLDNVSDYIDDEQEAITRMVSASLRHGADINFVVHQLEKTKGDLYSFAKALSRVLKKHVKDGAKVPGEHCPKCEGHNIQRKEGCKMCGDCGWSGCN